MVSGGSLPHSLYPMNKISSHYLALKAIKKYKRPMSTMEITQIIKKQTRLTGRTPQNTISSILQRSACVKKINAGWVLVRDPDTFYRC